MSNKIVITPHFIKTLSQLCEENSYDYKDLSKDIGKNESYISGIILGRNQGIFKNTCEKIISCLSERISKNNSTEKKEDAKKIAAYLEQQLLDNINQLSDTEPTSNSFSTINEANSDGWEHFKDFDLDDDLNDIKEILLDLAWTYEKTNERKDFIKTIKNNLKGDTFIALEYLGIDFTEIPHSRRKEVFQKIKEIIKNSKELPLS